MSYILNAQGYHDKAIAQKWIQLFEMKLYGVPKHKKNKIWRVITSCKNEEQLERYYYIVKDYSECMSFFDDYNLRTWIIYHVYKLMRFL